MRLLIRSDGSSRIGFGHMMRCLALGQAWQEAGGTVEFLTRCESTEVMDRLVSEGMKVSVLAEGEDWPGLENAVRSGCRPAALVLDGYRFGPEYQQRARDLCHPLLVIDDNAHLSYYCADIVLNQNIYAGELHYEVGPHTQLLLGCRWVLLRKEFRQWRSWQRKVPARASKVLVTVGGSDPQNVTAKVIEALKTCASHDKLKAVIVAGGGNLHVSALKSAVAGSKTIELQFSVQDMPSLMAWADVAITAAGSTCWETSFMGLPSMTFTVAGNQEGVARRLEQIGATINLGWPRDLSARRIALQLDALLASYSKRQRMSDNCRELVGGDGASATVAAISILL